jgi:prepilin signal peptidase PulO-like enzyme (type II secretory pathway)
MALTVYDLRWKLLPDKLMRPLYPLALILAIVEAARASRPAAAVLNTALAVLVGGGVFYLLYQVSKGKWIGGGDVKLGFLLGLIMATPGRSVLLIFLASLLGTLISLPLLASKRLNRHSTIPFGPFLILAAVVVQLFGQVMLDWYQRTFFPFI